MLMLLLLATALCYARRLVDTRIQCTRGADCRVYAAAPAAWPAAILLGTTHRNTAGDDDVA
jgi:hypothetical protein